MSKSFLGWIAVVALVATAGTFLASGHDTSRGCFVNDVAINEKALQGEAVPQSDSPPVYVLERGFPFRYYRQAFPADCTFNDGAAAPTSSQINAGHLVLDWLIWFALVLVISLGIKKVGAKS
ncbi:MAG TPA: hypothetical protein VFH99_01685 [Candidatus Saccharimonadales bacterium]|nr:hypothetical protein [Candidatus Saccharimonadales bacterium]